MILRTFSQVTKWRPERPLAADSSFLLCFGHSLRQLAAPSLARRECAAQVGREDRKMHEASQQFIKLNIEKAKRFTVNQIVD